MPRPPHIHVNQITAALTAANLLVDVRGELPNTVTSVEDDSRRVTAGGLFIAVRGSERDGHDFLERAAEAGAAVAVVEHPKRTTLPAIIVRDANAPVLSGVPAVSPACTLTRS